MNRVNHETYLELTHSMIMGLAESQLNLAQVARLLWATAQPEAEESTTDVTAEVRAALSDWSNENRAGLIAVEHVIILFPCPQMHVGGEACGKAKHSIMLTRVIGSMGWDPEAVPSSHDFNQTILDLTIEKHPEHGDGALRLAGWASSRNRSGLADAFQQLFGDGKQRIDEEVKDFRAELDALFPSIPTQGKEDHGDDTTSTG